MNSTDLQSVTVTNHFILFIFSQPLRFAHRVLLHRDFDLNSINRSALSRAHPSHLDCLGHFYAFDCNESRRELFSACSFN